MNDGESDLTESLLVASRALVAVAARSLAKVDVEVTLPQYRALVVLASRGSLRVGDLADSLGVHRSTATRLCDRLIVRKLIRRLVDPANRRETDISLAPRGRTLVDTVTDLRREEIAAIVGRIPRRLRHPAVDALVAFADAAGEPPSEAWMLGW